MSERDIRKYVYQGGFILVCFFVCLLGYIIYLQTFCADDLVKNPLNKRNSLLSDDIIRGAIFDSKGEKLAFSSQPGEREYPFGAAAAPVTGYIGSRIGNAGMEGYINNELTGKNEQLTKMGPIAQLFSSDRGNDAKLTIDADLQQGIYQSLGNRKGAVVVMDAATGAILAMVSKPSYNPAITEQSWSELNSNQDSPLLNRALQGLYPPGSTLKVMIADESLQDKVTDLQEQFNCTGNLQIGSYNMGESHGTVHGKVDLAKAVTVSCNVTFATLAMRLGSDKMEDSFQRFGFTKAVDNEIQMIPSHLPDFAKASQGDIAQIGIGQGDLLVTPLHMALLAEAFANGGKIMKPYLLDEIISPGGFVMYHSSPQTWFTATNAERAAIIDGFMENVVAHGTGTAAQVQSVRVTGKTGTAENPAGADHAWFIGSATLPKRKIVFAIILENSGGGCTEAAPIAKMIINNLLDK